MTSSNWSTPPLLDRGFTYLVLKDLFHLKAGTTVQVLNAQYHSNRDDGGYILEFLDSNEIRLHREFDVKIIDHINDYFRQAQPFDWDTAMARLAEERKKAIEDYEDQFRKELHRTNDRTKEVIDRLVKEKGLSPKEAYQYAVKNGLLR